MTERKLYVKDILDAPILDLPEFKFPDKTECIVAWRAWKVTRYGMLQSTNNTLWEPNRAQIAECRIRPTPNHTPPYKHCSCGVYAARSFGQAASYLQPYGLIGEVYLWGKVIPGSLAFRAQYAYPKHLWYVAELDISPLLFLKLDKDFPNYIEDQENKRLLEKKPVIPFMLEDYGVPVDIMLQDDYNRLCQ